MTDASVPRPQLKIRRVHLDTGRENVAVISRRNIASDGSDCPALPPLTTTFISSQ